jgi:hypothetical protein
VLGADFKERSANAELLNDGRAELVQRMLKSCPLLSLHRYKKPEECQLKRLSGDWRAHILLPRQHKSTSGRVALSFRTRT